eukprot:TRINITY_DN824_c0_g2_i1.p1 TRINITY_DN824_c0_g2~~TRINITY_DN824_c0_g2_i1.p1  ORF type:complete len:247 (-),score=-67.33 TRINITY_DN824_c0_g2_i1:372-1112(-)
MFSLSRKVSNVDYELFNRNNFSIHSWSWNYRGCWHQTFPPIVTRTPLYIVPIPIAPSRQREVGHWYLSSLFRCISIQQFTRLLPSLEVVAVSQATSPKSNPNSSLPVDTMVGPDPTIQLIGQKFLQCIAVSECDPTLLQFALLSYFTWRLLHCPGCGVLWALVILPATSQFDPRACNATGFLFSQVSLPPGMPHPAVRFYPHASQVSFYFHPSSVMSSSPLLDPSVQTSLLLAMPSAPEFPLSSLC